jgi:hypothetical protein
MKCYNCICVLPKSKLKHYKYNEKNGYKTFCSRECSNGNKRTGLAIKCSVCEIDIYKEKSVIDKSKSGLCYCSRRCATIANNKHKINELNPNFKDGNGSYRRRAIRHYELKCANSACPLEENKIQIPEQLYEVDHIDSNRKNSKVTNLQILCIFCHRTKTLNL